MNSDKLASVEQALYDAFLFGRIFQMEADGTTPSDWGKAIDTNNKFKKMIVDILDELSEKD